MDETAFRAALARAEKLVKESAADQAKTAQQYARVQTKAQEWITTQYGKETAKRIAMAVEDLKVRKQLAGTEAAYLIKAIESVTAAKAKEDAKRARAESAAARKRERIAFNVSKLEMQYSREVATQYLAELKRREKAGEKLTLTRLNEVRQLVEFEVQAVRRTEAEHLRAMKKIEADDKVTKRRLIEQVKLLQVHELQAAQLRVAETKKAATQTEAIHRTTFEQKKALLLQQMTLERTATVAVLQGELEKQAAIQRTAAMSLATTQSNLARVTGAHRQATRDIGAFWKSAGDTIHRYGTSMTEVGRSVITGLVGPLAMASAVVSGLGISAADSMVGSQTALRGMGLTPQATGTQIAGLRDFGVKTPYSVEDMFKYGTQYTNAILSHDQKFLTGTDKQKADAAAHASEEAVKLVKALGDMAAAGGITDTAKLTNAFSAMATMIDADRAGLRNVKQLANNVNFPVQMMATLFGFKDRAYSEKELKKKADAQKAAGIQLEIPKIYTASGQMMDWMARAKTTGGVSGMGIMQAVLDRAQALGSGKPGSPAEKMGAATISGRARNMFEAAKFSMADYFVSDANGDGLLEYTGAGQKIMGKGGVFDKLEEMGGVLKGPTGEMITTFFEAIGTLADWAKKLSDWLAEHDELRQTFLEFAKLAAVVAPLALAAGLLTKLLGRLIKLGSPLVKLVSGIAMGGKGLAKVAGQATGVGTQTDAQREAQRLREETDRDNERKRQEAKANARQRKAEADRALKDAKKQPKGAERDRAIEEAKRQQRRAAMDSRNESRRTKRDTERATREAERRGREMVREGQDRTSFRERYQQRRGNANEGDDRSLARRGIDRARGTNSQQERLTLDISAYEDAIRKAKEQAKELEQKIAELNRKNLDALAAEYANSAGSVQDTAQKAKAASDDVKRAAESLNQVKLDQLRSKVTDNSAALNELKRKITDAQGEVDQLDGKGLGKFKSQINSSSGASDSLAEKVRAAAGAVSNLNDRGLGKLRRQLGDAESAARNADREIDGASADMDVLDGKKLGKVKKEINDLKSALNETGDKADRLKGLLGDIESKAPGGSSGGGDKKPKKKAAKGAVMPGYAPGVDNIPAVLSPGEAVLRPEVTRAIGADRINFWNSQALRGKVTQRFAKGGIVESLGLDKLIDYTKSQNIGVDAMGLLGNMDMAASSARLGGDVHRGVTLGTGTQASKWIGSDIAGKFKNNYDFMSKDLWGFLKRVPTGVGQVVGMVGGALAPTAGQLFWDDVWKGQSNIVARGEKFLGDLFSPDALLKMVKDFFGGIWDSAEGIWDAGSALVTDPIGTLEDAVGGVWDVATGTYDGVIDTVEALRMAMNSPKAYAGQVLGDMMSTAKESLPNTEGLFDFGDTKLKLKRPSVDGPAEQVMGLPGAGDAVTRWTPQVRMVLSQLGLPASYTDLILHRIRVESGGNPGAINLWDSNAKAGHPSQGLMQTIPSTFAAYAGPYRLRGINDPMASIYAGINYAMHRYGSRWPQALMGTKGYAKGTAGAAPGWAWVGEEGPELVNFSGGETVLTHTESLRAQVKTSRGYANGTPRTTGVAADALKGVESLNSAMKKLYQIITQAFTSGKIKSGTANDLNKWLDKENKELQKAVKDRADLAPKLKDANAKLAAVKKDEAEMASSISEKAKSQRSLAGIFNSEGVSVSSAINGLKSRLEAIKNFQANVNALVKRGFSKDIIAEIAQAGPEEGAAMAKELLNATAAQVTDLNKTYAAIGTASDSLGKSVAGSYYKAGRDAAQELVNGLTAKDTKLKKQIEALADEITKTLKKKLGVNAKTPVSAGLASLLTWLTGESQSVKGGTTKKPAPKEKKKTTRVTTTYSTDSKGRPVTTVTTTVTDPVTGTTTTTTERTVGGKTTKTTKVTKIKGYATGTLSASPGMALVGEKGPELVNLRGGERIYDAQETASMMSKGGRTYEIHIHEAKSENTTQSVLRAMQYADSMYGI
ncbi:transglycosylase SLT domain-containing protein [Streptomyces sp. NPDC056534]|uniref:transglycosylase SLT domain-containing protein n=1 Tax=Streptomyces sp. NPDC056534 TaxID=3345857 RepID=UPI0036CEAE8F